MDRLWYIINLFNINDSSIPFRVWFVRSAYLTDFMLWRGISQYSETKTNTPQKKKY